jgi:large subunit ribosomal protein L21e
MPFKYYHGRTGIVFNVTKRAVGVRVNKEVNGRIISKSINVALPHVHASKCRDEVIARRLSNEAHKKAVLEKKGINQMLAPQYRLYPYYATILFAAQPKSLKRIATQPKAGYFYTVENTPKTITPIPYVDLV